MFVSLTSTAEADGCRETTDVKQRPTRGSDERVGGRRVPEVGDTAGSQPAFPAVFWKEATFSVETQCTLLKDQMWNNEQRQRRSP